MERRDRRVKIECCSDVTSGSSQSSVMADSDWNCHWDLIKTILIRQAWPGPLLTSQAAAVSVRNLSTSQFWKHL